MNTKYWIKIVVTMLVIFAIGMAGTTIFRNTKSLLASSRPISLPTLSASFRLDGAKVGSMRTLMIERSAPRVIHGLHLTVRLDDSSTIGRLTNCVLMLQDPDKIDAHSLFSCATSKDSASLALQDF